MTFESIKSLLVKKGAKEGCSACERNLYSWVRYGRIALYEKSYSKMAMVDTLFSKNNLSDFIDTYSLRIETKGELVPIMDYLVSLGLDKEERSFIFDYLDYPKSIEVVECRGGSIMKIPDNLRGIVYLNGRKTDSNIHST